MAEFQNDRDALLQTAAERIMPLPIDGIADALRGVEITAPSTVFKASGGTTSPASITLTAKVALISGDVVWSVVSGTAALTGTGNSRTIAGSSVTTASVTVRATVTDGGNAYSDDFTIAKVQDGSPGFDGARGTVMLFTTVTGSAWSDTTANSLILSQTGSSVRVKGDLVTQANNALAYSQTRRWNGTAWEIQTHYFSGDMIVEKTLTAASIKGGSFSGETFTGGTFSGSKLLGSTEVSVTNNGNFTLQGIGHTGSVLYKAIYHGNTGVWDMDLTLNQYGPTYLADCRVDALEASSLDLKDPPTGTSGNQLVMNGRKFWMNIGGTGPVEVEIGIRIS